MPEPAPSPAFDVRTVLRDAGRRLSAAGIDTPLLDARLLLGYLLGRDAAWLIAHPDTVLDPVQQDSFDELVTRRVAREPVAHIVGIREFWSLTFETGPEVLTPRPDSETLVEAVLAAEPDRQRALRILDLGTGSGCLLLSVLSEYPNARGMGVDISPAAIQIARRNAARLGLAARTDWCVSDWAAVPDGEFDLVISNPPYIESAAIAALEPEVRAHEPLGALDGGTDGCDAYRDLLARVAGWMSDSAHVFLEHGEGQSDAVARIAGQNRLRVAGVHADLAGRARILVLTH